MVVVVALYLIGWRYQIDGLHVRQWFPFLANILHDGDSLGGNLVHLATRGDHSHSQLIDNQHFPLALLA